MINYLKKEMIMDFYLIINRYSRKKAPRISTHIVKAMSVVHALDIAEEHGIGNPFHPKDLILVTSRKLDLNNKLDKWRIDRRKKGIGGVIWYVNAKGKLKKYPATPKKSIWNFKWLYKKKK